MAQLTIKTKHNALAWALNFCKPVIEISGQKYQYKWGENSFNLAPGNYNVKIHYPYLGMKCGASEVDFSITENETKYMQYKAPMIIFAKGKIKFK